MGNTLANYDPFLVALSFAISVLGSFAALRLARVIPQQDREDQLPWVLGAAFALGAGAIWSMHFIGMLAFDMGMPISYNIPLTAFSMVLAWGVAALGFYVVSRDSRSWARLITAGVLAGSGVATMHYTGMAAMEMGATISYDPVLFGLSLVIAVVAATAALWLAFNIRSNVQMVGASVVMGIAVCGMHYTGMAAARFEPMANMTATDVMPLSNNFLAYAIFLFSLLVLGLGLAFGRDRSLEGTA